MRKRRRVLLVKGEDPKPSRGPFWYAFSQRALALAAGCCMETVSVAIRRGRLDPTDLADVARWITQRLRLGPRGTLRRPSTTAGTPIRPKPAPAGPKPPRYTSGGKRWGRPPKGGWPETPAPVSLLTVEPSAETAQTGETGPEQPPRDDSSGNTLKSEKC